MTHCTPEQHLCLARLLRSVSCVIEYTPSGSLPQDVGLTKECAAILMVCVPLAPGSIVAPLRGPLPLSDLDVHILGQAHMGCRTLLRTCPTCWDFLVHDLLLW